MVWGAGKKGYGDRKRRTKRDASDKVWGCEERAGGWRKKGLGAGGRLVDQAFP